MNDIKGIVTLSAVITRADGSVEDLGVISKLQGEAATEAIKLVKDQVGTLSEEQNSKEKH